MAGLDTLGQPIQRHLLKDGFNFAGQDSHHINTEDIAPNGDDSANVYALYGDGVGGMYLPETVTCTGDWFIEWRIFTEGSVNVYICGAFGTGNYFIRPRTGLPVQIRCGDNTTLTFANPYVDGALGMVQKNSTDGTFEYYLDGVFQDAVSIGLHTSDYTCSRLEGFSSFATQSRINYINLNNQNAYQIDADTEDNPVIVFDLIGTINSDVGGMVKQSFWSGGLAVPGRMIRNSSNGDTDVFCIKTKGENPLNREILSDGTFEVVRTSSGFLRVTYNGFGFSTTALLTVDEWVFVCHTVSNVDGSRTIYIGSDTVAPTALHSDTVTFPATSAKPMIIGNSDATTGLSLDGYETQYGHFTKVVDQTEVLKIWKKIKSKMK